MRRNLTPRRAHNVFITDQSIPITGYLTMTSADKEVGYPMRYFVTGGYSPVKAGQTVKSPQGEVFLLGNHTYKGSDVSLRAIPTHDELTWERPTEVIDPVTRMRKDSGTLTFENIHTNLMPITDEKDGLKIASSRFVFYTSEDVQPGDRVHSMNVSMVTPSIGLKRVVLSS